MKCYCLEMSENERTMNKMYEMSHSMVWNQKDLLTTPFEYISLKQLVFFFFCRKRDESFHSKKESLTAIWQFTSLWSLPGRDFQQNCEDWTELIYSIAQRINHFFRCIYRFAISPFRKYKKQFDICFWSPDDHVTFLSRLHILRRNFLRNFCSLLSHFFRVFYAIAFTCTKKIISFNVCG